MKRFQAAQLLQDFKKRVKMENTDEIFIGRIECLEVSLESLAITLVEGTIIEVKMEITRK